MQRTDYAPTYINTLHHTDQLSLRKFVWNHAFLRVTHAHVHYMQRTYYISRESTRFTTPANFPIGSSYGITLFCKLSTTTYITYSVQAIHPRTSTRFGILTNFPIGTLHGIVNFRTFPNAAQVCRRKTVDKEIVVSKTKGARNGRRL